MSECRETSSTALSFKLKWLLFLIYALLIDSYLHISDKAEEAVTTPDLHLHYMASTRKKIAETQDASTNTHPGKCYLCKLQQLFIGIVSS